MSHADLLKGTAVRDPHLQGVVADDRTPWNIFYRNRSFVTLTENRRILLPTGK